MKRMSQHRNAVKNSRFSSALTHEFIEQGLQSRFDHFLVAP